MYFNWLKFLRLWRVARVSVRWYDQNEDAIGIQGHCLKWVKEEGMFSFEPLALECTSSSFCQSQSLEQSSKEKDVLLNSKPQSGIVISTKPNHSFLEGMLAEAKEVFKAWEARYGDHKAHPSSYKDNKH